MSLRAALSSLTQLRAKGSIRRTTPNAQCNQCPMQSMPNAIKAQCNQGPMHSMEEAQRPLEEAQLPCPHDICLPACLPSRTSPRDSLPYLEEERDGGGDGLRARRGDVDDERERLAEVRARARVPVAAREDAAELREPQRLGSRAVRW